MESRTITVVLGGGRGTRLYPLTAGRAKPAVPLAGKYRLIDIPISNAINSGLRRIFVLTQFNSASLNRHVSRTYRFDPFTDAFVEVLAAEQTDRQGDSWFQGTADAVRKHLDRMLRAGAEYVLILSGDHLYRMPYDEMIAQHRRLGSAITVATYPVTRAECSGFGVLACDRGKTITAFREKPSDDEDISELMVPAGLRDAWGLGDRAYLASMGVYVFDVGLLAELLANEDHVDFGHDILPAAIEPHQVSAFLFEDYWEDIGTIRSFYEANLMLCSGGAPFHFHTPDAPIFTRARFLPPSMHRDCTLVEAMVADGCVVVDASVRRSVIGLRSVVRGCTIEDSVLMGADWYEPESRPGQVPLGIGRGSVVRGAIIDKNARIGANVRIEGGTARPDEDHEAWVVRDGIVIVRKNAVVPDGSVL